jgi:CheY-like chemotaxis protein
VSTFHEALTLVREQEGDIVVLDISLGDMWSGAMALAAALTYRTQHFGTRRVREIPVTNLPHGKTEPLDASL